MNKVQRTLEILVNVAILVTAGLVIATLAGGYRNTGGMASNPHEGTKLAIEGHDWSAVRSTVVLVLDTKCRHCAEGTPFYRRLAEAARREKAGLLAILPQAPADGKKYLSELAVNVNQVRQEDLVKLGFRGTPTILVVDRKGVVKRAWSGVPASQDQALKEFADLIR
ncbi:MAG: hypothetical protein HY820_43760 [Acidobacteria bacterium]|nr:hypothetical protein [Acidobacteriota bacterium]